MTTNRSGFVALPVFVIAAWVAAPGASGADLFAPAQFLPYPDDVTPAPLSAGVAIGDVDGDGRIEAIIPAPPSETTPRRPTAWIIEFRPDGLVVDGGVVTPLPNEPASSNFSDQAVLSDLDGDGDLDCIVREWVAPESGGFFAPAYAHQRYAVLHNTNGKFKYVQAHILDHASDFPPPFLLIDITGDGADDLVRVFGDPQVIEVRPALANGRFGKARLTRTHAGAFAESEIQSIGDVNGDGRCDVTVIGPGLGRTVYFGSASGRLTPGPTVAIAGNPGIVKADLNDDGLEDVVDFYVIVGTISDIALMRHSIALGNGEFDTNFEPVGEFTGAALDLSEADLFGDGRNEIAALHIFGDLRAFFGCIRRYGPANA